MTQPFLFAVLALVAFRVQRVITRDDWPPSELFRESVRVAFGKESGWYTFVTCPWCLGTWVTFGVFFVASFWLDLNPHWALQAGAAAAVVGLLDGLDS